MPTNTNKMAINYKETVLVMFQLSRNIFTIFKFPNSHFVICSTMGYSRKKKKKTWGLRPHFFENLPEIFHFFTLSLEIPDKTELRP